MCGIAGTIGDTREQVIEGMLERIAHRGPDDRGFCTLDNGLMGNVRLSIIDIAGGHQPMKSAAGDLAVVYNGELYGYKETRQRYLESGYPFRTTTDTEVILPLYREHGLSMFGHMNGMFAFCLHDSRRGLTVLVRDHLGIKPLVYTVLNGRLYFASETKAFYAVPEWSARADLDAWHTFLNIRFPPSPQTLFEGVSKIPPGCYMVIHNRHVEPPNIPTGHEHLSTIDLGDSQARIYRYYRLHTSGREYDYEGAVLALGEKLTRATEDQMVADVPVGLYLSGGIDSSTLTVLASRKAAGRVNTFCLGFGEPTDENRDAQVVAGQCGTNHTDTFLDEEPLQHFRQAVYFMEEPKVNCLQGFLLSREARKHQKVVLSGLGGDELFGGYDIYEIGLVLDVARRSGVRAAVSALGGLASRLSGTTGSLRADLRRRVADVASSIRDPLGLYLLLRNGWDHDATLRSAVYRREHTRRSVRSVREHFETSFPMGGSLAESFMRFEIENKMVDDFLANEDRMSMAHGLEARVPFLDRHVVELVYGLPVEWKIRLRNRKILLRSLMHDSVPGSVLRKKKHGFTFNPVLQFRKDLGSYAADHLSRKRVEEGRLFNYAFIEQVLNSRPHPSLRWHYFLLWMIAGYHIWEDVFVRNGGRADV